MDEFFETFARGGGDPYAHGYYPQCDEAWFDGTADVSVKQALQSGDGPILVYVGAFDPWHVGHSNALRSTVQVAERMFVHPIRGALIIPDNDVYAQQKRPDTYTSLPARLDAIHRDTSLADVPCPVIPCDLAGRFTDAAPNFTHILLTVRELYGTPDSVIGLIVGQDNACFAPVVASIPGFATFVVQRDGAPRFDGHPHTKFVPVEDSAYLRASSTAVRASA